MRGAFAAAVLAMVCACGSGTPVVPDAGSPDGGSRDAGVPDAGLQDAGPRDGGYQDAGGSPDAGVEPDAGLDAGEGGDAGDSGVSDAGPCPVLAAFVPTSDGGVCVDLYEGLLIQLFPDG